MRKRGNRNRNHYSVQYWWHRLKQFWRSLVRSIRMFFTDDLDRRGGHESPSANISEQSVNEHFDDELLMPQPAIAVPRAIPFLLGLDDLPDLDLLTTRDLVDHIEWNADTRELVMAKEEDLNLLEDLLTNFPDS